MIGAIFATDVEHGFSKDGKIPWHIPEDFNFFRQVTLGGTIVMGRSTFESLPRVLPRRHHVVLTRDRDYSHEWLQDPNVTVVHSLEEMQVFAGNNYWVIGGTDLIYEVGTVVGYDLVYHTTVKNQIHGCNHKIDLGMVVGFMEEVDTMDMRDFIVRKYINRDKF